MARSRKAPGLWGVKTKPTVPWRIKPGDRVALYLLPDSGPRVVTITRAYQYRSTFTGATVWRFHYADPWTGHDSTFTAHGRRRSPHPRIADWPAEKVERVID